jgi:CRISPR-associated endonuclease/helicase Cas3
LTPRVELPWGKTGADGGYHPAIFHMLDVGHVAQTLLDNHADPRLLNVLGLVFRDAQLRALRPWLPLIVALHDIGKISAPFQGQSSRTPTRLQRERLENEGFDFGRLRGQTYRHQVITAVWAEGSPSLRDLDLDPSLVECLRDAFGGHHGMFAETRSVREARAYVDRDEPSEWAALREEAFAILQSRLVADAGDVSRVRVHALRPATMALVGFIILCDWLGSDGFGCSAPLPLENYGERSRRLARQVVERADFLPVSPPPPYQGFRNLFPEIANPRPLQEAVESLVPDLVRSPSLYIIEAPTGEGKTEAAFTLAARLATASGADGLYFGLPTTATSNQMFARMHSFLAARLPGPQVVKLVHGQAFLAEDDLLVRLQADSDEVNARAADAWFSPKKRALLARFGVGTVDQIELTTLNARHYMLRLFGLAGKVVIVDEMHAYDVYMSTILDAALAWLASLGASVIVLSATLPARRHRELAAAFLGPLGAQLSGDRVDIPAPYPCLAVYGSEASAVRYVGSGQPDKSLTMRLIPDESPGRQAERLMRLVEDGGAVCRLCNTVDDAQRIFCAVRSLALEGVKCVLIHSRFPMSQRAEVEARLVREFGPRSGRLPGEKAIVVATQVLEQSLDLDFDVMVSDFAPIDLLLQRAGRVFRHDRVRPPEHTGPVVYLRLPTDETERPQFGVWGFVYDEYVLWKTWLELTKLAAGATELQVRLPAEYRRLIEAVYGADPVCVPADHGFKESIDAAYHRHVQDQASAKGNASLRLAPRPDRPEGITEGVNIEFEEDEDGGSIGWGIARTRDGAESVTVVPLFRSEDGPTVDEEGCCPLAQYSSAPGQLALRRRSIPVTVTRGRQGLVHAWRLEWQKQPAWFRDASRLQGCLPLILDGHSMSGGGMDATLSPDLGLVLRRTEKS